MARPPMLRRLWKAGVLLLVGLVVGALLLPVPLIHLFGVTHGTCPSCHQEGDYFIGFGGRRVSFPITTSCPHCKVSLELTAAPDPARGPLG